MLHEERQEVSRCRTLLAYDIDLNINDASCYMKSVRKSPVVEHCWLMISILIYGQNEFEFLRKSSFNKNKIF